MTIKLLCPCGTKFAFDVEPVNGRMPAPVACPTCSADGTEAANALIRQSTSATPAKTAAVRVPVATIVPSAPPPPAQPVVAPGVPNAAPADGPVYCPKHPPEISVAECRVCGKPICGRCMEMFGFVCSVYCRSQAEARGIDVPQYAQQASRVGAHKSRKVKRLAALAGVALAGLLGLVIWYNYWGTKPKVVFSVDLPEADRPAACRLLSESRLLVLNARRLAAFDMDSGKEVWATPLEGGPAKPKPKLEPSLAALNLDFEPAPPVYLGGGDVWVMFDDRVARFDQATGKRKDDVRIPGRPRQSHADGQWLLVVSGDEFDRATLTRIALADGKASTETVSLAAPKSPAGALALADAEFLPSADGVWQCQRQMLEERVEMRQAMRERKEPSRMETGNISAANSLEAARDLINDMQRESTGGMAAEDVSRYRVTLQRRLPGGAAWSGEVEGRPFFACLETVNLVAAGRTLLAFNKSNQKLWAAKLAYPCAGSAEDDDPADVPCLEAAGMVFLADKGALHAFDLKSGEARWHVTSVGIKSLHLDAEGRLVVMSTSASPDSLKYSQEFDPAHRPAPVLMRVDAASGQVLWVKEEVGDQVVLAGRYLYTTRAQRSMVEVIVAGNDAESAPVHHRLRRINPKTGAELWLYYRPRKPAHLEAVGKTILLQYKGRADVLRFREL